MLQVREEMRRLRALQVMPPPPLPAPPLMALPAGPVGGQAGPPANDAEAEAAEVFAAAAAAAIVAEDPLVLDLLRNPEVVAAGLAVGNVNEPGDLAAAVAAAIEKYRPGYFQQQQAAAAAAAAAAGKGRRPAADRQPVVPDAPVEPAGAHDVFV